MTDETIEPSLAESRSGEELLSEARALIEVLIENDPNDSISDAGHSVLDLWRDDAAIWLSRLPTGGVTSPEYVMVPRETCKLIANHLDGEARNAYEVGAEASVGRLIKFRDALLAAAPPSPRSDELKKRPAAFRVWSNGHWAYFDDEDVARDFAGEGDYQGLYVRDGGQP